MISAKFMAKCIVEESKRISVWWLKKNGYFRGWDSGTVTWTSKWDDTKSSIGLTVDINARKVRFTYTQTDYWSDEKRDMDYTHGITTTPCFYGGVRYWFRCDLIASGRYCGRRVGALYKPPGAWYYGCRYCYHLSYYERNQSKGGRFSALTVLVGLEEKAEKLEEAIKRRKWRGVPTRKQRRLNRLYGRMSLVGPLLDRQMDSLLAKKKGV